MAIHPTATYQVNAGAVEKVVAAIEEFVDHIRAFESVYSPELAGGPVVFTDFVLVADNSAT